MTKRHPQIPVTCLLEYLKACRPLLGRVSDELRSNSRLSNVAMHLISAVSVLDIHLHRYQRTGLWDGPPPFLAEYTEEAPSP